MNPTDPQSRPPASSPSTTALRRSIQSELGNSVEEQQALAAVTLAEATSQWMKLVGNDIIYTRMDGSSPRSDVSQVSQRYESWRVMQAAVEAWDLIQ